MKKFLTYLILVSIFYLFNNPIAFSQPFVELLPRLTSSTGAFGRSVDISGNLVAVGDYLARDAQIFTLNPDGTKTVGPILTPSDPLTAFSYGWDVAISGNCAVVGAQAEAIGGFTGAGAAYVYCKDFPTANAWGLVKKLVSPSPTTTGNFGASVAIDGDEILVGAQGEGRSYFFSKDNGGSNNWGAAGGPAPGGANVAIDGDFAIMSQTGGASIWEKTGSSPSLWAATGTNFPGGSSLFGTGSSISGNIAVVGDADAGGSGMGAVRIYEEDMGAWSLITTVSVPTAAQFGWSVDIDGDLLIVGANSAREVYFFKKDEGGTDNWGQVGMFSEGFQFGISVAISGLRSVVGSEARTAYFYGPDPSAPVPVTWSNFDAAREGESVALRWQTSSEQNNSHFIIERSTDGIQFSSIGQVNGVGTTTQTTDYQFMDSKPANGLNYYRLQQVDYDGTTDYSAVEVVAINNQQRQLGAIFPNPSKDGQFQVDYNALQAERVQISILDYTGKILRSKQMQLKNGLNRLHFNLNDLNKGVYILQLNTGGVMENKKVVIN